ncbi:MAG: electron transfer flavoprotein subunit alpha/FixB family protein [Thermoanaerobacteraceae bacterium]|nr:electron transfer flavoprotein subunit alpha/FixB family protein [Thermoanaerobacteraceae bacterium]
MRDHEDILVFTEFKDGHPLKVGLEILSKARGLADEMSGGLYAMVLTDRADGFDMLFKYGADRVYAGIDESFRYYTGAYFSRMAVSLVENIKPYAFIIGATAMGSMFAPEVAAYLKTGLAAHVIDYKIDHAGNLVQVVPSFGSRVAAEILTPHSRPQMSTVRPGTFELKENLRNGSIVHLDTSELDYIAPRVTPLGFEEVKPEGMPLEDAEVVVVGGGGIETREDWENLKELSRLLNGALGCTRPIVDKGWSDEAHMVGTSGKTIKPKVYIGIAVSGSSHHITGMKDSGLVIAINKDENAPIFDVADIRIVADYKEILPALLSMIKG